MDSVRLRCVKEGSRLRVRIISPGYSPAANCQFPRDIRAEGREYEVPATDIHLSEHPRSHKFFYSIRKNNIRVVEATPELVHLRVYGDPDHCAVCLEEDDIEYVVFAPCGHCACCADCGKEVFKTCGCPICRAKIARVVLKTELAE